MTRIALHRPAGLVLRPTFPLATQRLLLRPFTEDDLDALELGHRS